MPAWESLHGLINDERYMETLKLFTFQAGHAIVWRDAINDWFHRISGLDDAQGRVGHHPGRIEPETMTASGYTPVDITPWETASGGKAVVCKVAAAAPLHYPRQTRRHLRHRRAILSTSAPASRTSSSSSTAGR